LIIDINRLSWQKSKNTNHIFETEYNGQKTYDNSIVEKLNELGIKRDFSTDDYTVKTVNNKIKAWYDSPDCYKNLWSWYRIDKDSKDKEERKEKRFYFMSFEEFKKIYFADEELDKRVCDYCGINESEIHYLIIKGEVKTKRLYSRGRSLEIDKKKPNEDYTPENIVLSCYWCNNAKTDEYTYEEFKSIGVLNKLIWENRIKDKKWSSEMYDKLEKGIEALDIE